MRYRVIHTTSYTYKDTVPLCHNLAMLTPRETANQHCDSFRLDIFPVPEIIEEYNDFFGNKVYYFVIEQEHIRLSVTTTSVIEKNTTIPAAHLQTMDSWESVKQWLRDPENRAMDIRQYVFPTEITDAPENIREYAAQSFTPGRSLFEAVYELMNRIHSDFIYTSGFTTISTPISVVMREKKGVCQDFAHLGIACLQAMGLAARYVSGYLETLPPPGVQKLTGADASHAWFSVFIPGMGWVDFDPTNNRLPGEQYIVIGWGRNYFDIIPLRGVIQSGDKHQLNVSVDVMPLP